MRHGYFLILSVLGFSCTEISYKEPQPKGVQSLQTIPKKLRGSYQLTENGILLDDIVVVVENGYRLEPREKTQKVEEFLLSDSLVIKYYRGYYFVNSRATYTWHLRVVQRKKNGDLELLEMENVPENEERRKEFPDRLQAEVPVINTEINGSMQYVIDPTPRKLRELIQKGFFKRKTLLVKKEAL